MMDMSIIAYHGRFMEALTIEKQERISDSLSLLIYGQILND